MATMLKQSTAVTIRLGPALDKTDGVTEETGLSPTVEISKNHGAFAARNSATAIAHDSNGWYSVELDATDTGTLGPLLAKFDDASTHLPVWREFLVVTANVYDTFCSTDLFQTDLTQIGGDAQSATDLKDFADAGYDPATNKVQGVVLVDTLTTYTGNTPQTGDAFARLGAPAGASVSADVAAVKAQTAAIETDTQDIQTKIGSPAGASVSADIAAVKSETAAIKAKTDNLPTDPADQSLVIAATDALAALIGTPADTDIATDLANILAALAVIDGIVDSILDDTGTTGVAIKAGGVDAAAVATDAVNEIADGLLDRNMATGSDSGSETVRTVRQALRSLRNFVNIAAGTLTVMKEDDTTPSWTAAVTTTAGNPVSEINPTST